MIRILIDGYNLLNATDLEAPRVSSRITELERARNALLDFLAETLAARDCAATTVVFDATAAPPGLPRAFEYRGIAVRFAPRSAEADDLIEQLIAAHHSPKQLTVVSSDHRIHRAARRRRARAVDSEVWFREMVRCGSRADSPAGQSTVAEKPQPAGDLAAWLAEFLHDQEVRRLGCELQQPLPPPEQSPAEKPRSKKQRRPAKDRKKTAPEPPEDPKPDVGNPFPPGYGEDLDLGDDDPLLGY